MKLTSHLKDVISGKIYKQNTLLFNNADRIYRKTESWPDSDFLKHWIRAAIVSSMSILNDLIFEDFKVTNEQERVVNANSFKTNSQHLNERSVFELFKLLAGYHLTIFFKKERQLGLTQEEFEERVFSAFDFTRDDEKNYKELFLEYSSNPPPYLGHLFDQFFTKGYELPYEDKRTEAATVFFFESLFQSYSAFLKVLQENISNL